MNKIIVTTFLIIINFCAYSQKVVVGILERAYSNSNRYDYYYTVSTGSGTQKELELAMENKLKKNPQYNWKTDFPYSHVGYEGQYYVVIIKYNKKYGVGIEDNYTDALEEAKKLIRAYYYINDVSNYETIYSEDLSEGMNKPPDKPDIINPKNNTTISTTSVELKWDCNDSDNDELTYEILFGKEGEYLVSIANDYYSTSIIKTGLLRGEKYNWRVIVSDGKAEKKWTDASFYVSDIGKVNATSKTICPVCAGKGKVYVPVSYRTCTACNGTGKIKWRSGFYHKCEPPIGACYGTGKIKVEAHWEGCTHCNGTGYISN